MIPMVMRLEIREGNKRGINLWLPLFLLWILLLPLILLILLGWMILKTVSGIADSANHAALFIEAAVAVLRELDKLYVDIRTRDSRVRLHF